jgi:hypothetical protein
VIDAQPKPGYKPKAKRADLLTKIRGKIWVDQMDYQWVKAEVEVIDAISVGLACSHRAGRHGVRFEQTRVNDEVWLPLRCECRGQRATGVLKEAARELDITYRNYRKFQTDSRSWKWSDYGCGELTCVSFQRLRGGTKKMDTAQSDASIMDHERVNHRRQSL